MPSRSSGDPVPSGPPRRPEQLLLAFLGELVLDRDLGPVPTAFLVDLLGALGAGEPATRAALARMVRRDLLAPVRAGRSVGYLLTPTSERVLRDAHGRIFAPDPFAPDGEGWTLVTFSVPEARRDLRHRVRAQLSWAGFGLLRDGLWIAPGEVDLTDVLGEFAHDSEVDLVAFRAVEVDGFSVAAGVEGAWRLDDIRARHLEFQARWGEVESGPSDPDGAPDGPRAVREVTALVADWLALLRAVPRLPLAHLGDGWPSRTSVEVFRRRHEPLARAARVEVARVLGP